jgi:hypothetical protein
MMECPSCFQRIIVPQAPASDDVELIITGSKARRQSAPKSETNLETPPAKKSPVAKIAFVILFCAVIAAAFVFGGKIFKSAPTGTIAVNNVSNTSSNPAPVSSTATVSAGDIALGKPAIASSEESGKGNLIQNGNDGNTATRWCASSGGLPQWWEVDLGGTTTVTNTQILWERNAIYQYVIEVSLDRTSWTVVVDKTANSVPVQTSSDDFSAKGGYVRVVITGLQQDSWASFYEFQAFGSSNSKK